MLLKVSEQYKCDSEDLAKRTIDEFKEQQTEKGYTLSKAGYTYKTKKSKGEVIVECWVVDVTMTYGGVWDDL